MKNVKLTTLTLMLAISMQALAGDKIVTAEQLAIDHDSSIAFKVGESLGYTFYDGPYDGEKAIDACEYDLGPGCLYYDSVLDNQIYEHKPAGTNQDIENFIYYHAFRNVLAGHYLSKEYSKYLHSVTKLLEKEVFYIKTGQKTLSLEPFNQVIADLLIKTREVYTSE